MPTVFRIGSLKIQVFADNHYPPHFHIVGSEFEVLVSLSDLSILRGERYRRHIGEALELAAQNLEILRQEWSRLND